MRILQARLEEFKQAAVDYIWQDKEKDIGTIQTWLLLSNDKTEFKIQINMAML